MTIAAGPRRACPWHLTDVRETEDGELACIGHHPRAWLVLDDLDRIVGAGAVGAEVALVVHPPLPLACFIEGPWLHLRAPRRTFGLGAAVWRRAIAAKRKTRGFVDTGSESPAPCPR